MFWKKGNKKMVDIAGGRSTPRVVMDGDNKLCIIEGQSYPENSSSFYRPIIKWIEEYISKDDAELILKLKFIYLNSSSVKVMFYIFDVLEGAYKNGKNIKIDWQYDHENETAKEIGEELLEDFSLPYSIIEV